MRRLLTYISSPIGNYDYIRPWKDEMFNSEQKTVRWMQYMLQQMSHIHEDDR